MNIELLSPTLFVASSDRLSSTGFPWKRFRWCHFGSQSQGCLRRFRDGHRDFIERDRMRSPGTSNDGYWEEGDFPYWSCTGLEKRLKAGPPLRKGRTGFVLCAFPFEVVGWLDSFFSFLLGFFPSCLVQDNFLLNSHWLLLLWYLQLNCGCSLAWHAMITIKGENWTPRLGVWSPLAERISMKRAKKTRNRPWSDSLVGFSRKCGAP